MNILHICANPKPTEESASKQLAAAFFAQMVESCPDVQINNVDLYEDQPPYLNYETYKGFWYPVFIDGYSPTDEEEASMAYARKHADMFNEADVVVITAPMWNFSVPAILKAWTDQVLAPGFTFELSSDGPKPLHKVKKIVLLAASGGVYKEDDPRDSLTRQIEAAFGFVGIEDISIAWAEGQNPLFFTDNDERKQMALEAAQELAEDVADLDD